MRDMLTAYSEELNRQGGIYERKITWQFADMVMDPAITAGNALNVLRGLTGIEKRLKRIKS
ncbi:MAG: hypothetical protein ACR2LM_15455 [Pyrinomonadaceae bacterium]